MTEKDVLDGIEKGDAVGHWFLEAFAAGNQTHTAGAFVDNRGGHRLPEVIVAASCSKNMGLYRERTGAAIFICRDEDNAQALVSQGLVAARRVYSMPPAHGALLAGRILSDDVLEALWRSELDTMCARINGLRSKLVARLEAASARDFSFIQREKGMFSFLGLSVEQAQRLRNEHSVYMLDSSRINVAGVNASNIDYLATAVAKVL